MKKLGFGSSAASIAHKDTLNPNSETDVQHLTAAQVAVVGSSVTGGVIRTIADPLTQAQYEALPEHPSSVLYPIIVNPD